VIAEMADVRLVRRMELEVGLGLFTPEKTVSDRRKRGAR
jgi:hypothetical protein